MRVLLQSAFVLHHRPYRESSVLLDIFSKDHGRISLIARGARQNRSMLRALLQPFSPLLISWQGKTELMTLQSVEADGAPYHLKRECLASGFYLNELLMRLLQKQDPHARLYGNYQQTLLELQTSPLQLNVLRLFEKKLLAELGYGIQLESTLFSPEQFYQYHPEQGFRPCENKVGSFKGKSLLAFAREQFDDDESLRDAKRLTRIALAFLLGGRPLQSRKLFIGSQNVREREESTQF